jgi:hypothetical protein
MLLLVWHHGVVVPDPDPDPDPDIDIDIDSDGASDSRGGNMKPRGGCRGAS